MSFASIVVLLAEVAAAQITSPPAASEHDARSDPPPELNPPEASRDDARSDPPLDPLNPPDGYQKPFELPYRPGEPVPIGYHLREEPRRGFVTAGYIVTGVPYAIGVYATAGANFRNATPWLLVPFAGPWLTMGQRDYHDCWSQGSEERDTADDARCTADVLVFSGLIVSGFLQTVGGTFLLIGYLSKKKKLVRDDLAISVAPLPVPSGYGLTAYGTF